VKTGIFAKKTGQKPVKTPINDANSLQKSYNSGIFNSTKLADPPANELLWCCDSQKSLENTAK